MGCTHVTIIDADFDMNCEELRTLAKRGTEPDPVSATIGDYFVKAISALESLVMACLSNLRG